MTNASNRRNRDSAANGWGGVEMSMSVVLDKAGKVPPFTEMVILAKFEGD
jgi:hypothetical protein